MGDQDLQPREGLGRALSTHVQNVELTLLLDFVPLHKIESSPFPQTYGGNPVNGEEDNSTQQQKKIAQFPYQNSHSHQIAILYFSYFQIDSFIAVVIAIVSFFNFRLYVHMYHVNFD